MSLQVHRGGRNESGNLLGFYSCGQLAQPNVAKLDGSTFGFETKVSRGWGNIFATGNLLAIYPESYFAVDCPYIVMIPLVDSLGRLLGRKAPLAIGCYGRKRFHLDRADGKNVTMTGKPVGRFLVLFGINFRISQIQHLHLDPVRQAPMPGSELGYAGRSPPNENARVSTLLLMHPLKEQLEIFQGLAVADDSGGLARTEGMGPFPAPGVGEAVDVYEIFPREHLPARFLASGRNGFLRLGSDRAGFPRATSLQVTRQIGQFLILQAKLGSGGHP